MSLKSRLCALAVLLLGVPALIAAVGPSKPVAGGTEKPVDIEMSPNGVQPVDSVVFCQKGFSKNMCNGLLRGGFWTTQTCTDSTGYTCATLVGTNVSFVANILSNPDPCNPGIPGSCDETQDLFGPMNARWNVRIRQDGQCNPRGCWAAKWTWLAPVNPPFIQAGGGMNGTLGVGTHRPTLCINSDGTSTQCGRDCETCFAAFFDPAIDQWKIHFEGCMNGQITAGPRKGCRICATLMGDFVAVGNQNGPLPPVAPLPPWTFCGTIDGVLECPCTNGPPH